MPKLTKRCVDAAEPKDTDFFVWDDELPGFGLRVFNSGKRSYLVQYRAGGRTRRVTIGPHGSWTPEEARREARSLLGRIAKGDNPAEEREIDRKTITVTELCQRYFTDADHGLILGKKRQPKKPSTLLTDRGRVDRHIIPLLGSRLVKDVNTTDVNRFLKDVSAGKTKADKKTRRYGRAIVRGGRGTASRTTGLLGGIFTYAVMHGIIATNPVRGVRRPADLSDITPHVLRHSFASTANDLGFTEATIAAMLGHSRGTVTSRYVHHVDGALVAAADAVASQISSFIRSRRSNEVKNTAEARPNGFGIGQIFPIAAE